MDSKKLNKLCDEARIQGFDLSEIFVVDSDSDKEKVQKLKIVVRCINNLEKTKKQIENEISITKEMAKEELECSKNYILSTSEYIGESIKHALSMNSNAEMIKYIDAAIYGLNCLNENIGYLETLRERLSFEEEEENEL